MANKNRQTRMCYFIYSNFSIDGGDLKHVFLPQLLVVVPTIIVCEDCHFFPETLFVGASFLSKI